MSGRHLRRGISRCLDLLLAPGLCLACGCRLEAAVSICRECAQHFEPVPRPCGYCAQPNPVEGEICPACMLNPPPWQRMIAAFQYRGPVRDYLLQLKYSQSPYLTRCLCEQSYSVLRRQQSFPEVLLPVPLHRSRLLQRGYNQAEEIAGLWSRRFDVPLDRKALTRMRATPSQSGLNAAERIVNLRQAFNYAPRKTYRHVAVVDDIVTTGATAGEIARLLQRNGVEYVEVWALARVYRR